MDLNMKLGLKTHFLVKIQKKQYIFFRILLFAYKNGFAEAKKAALINLDLNRSGLIFNGIRKAD